MKAPYCDKAWMGESATSLYRHMSDGLSASRCGFDQGPWCSIRTTLTWDHVTCPDCKAKRQSYEPETQWIDTRGD